MAVPPRQQSNSQRLTGSVVISRDEGVLGETLGFLLVLRWGSRRLEKPTGATP